MLAAPDVIAGFGLPGTATGMIPVAAGEMGRIWRLDTTSGRYAVKELFWDSDEDTVRREVALRDAAAAAGIRAPANIAGPDGCYLRDRLRCYEWIDGVAMRPDEPGRSEWLGRTLARLHCLRPPVEERPRDPGEDWYDTAPAASEWDRLASVDRPWASAVEHARPRLRELARMATRSDQPMIFSHRDLQAQNVLIDGDGPVLLDWEDAGPVAPDRALAGALCTWHVRPERIDEAGITATMRAYRQGGGAARLKWPDSFGGIFAGALNFIVAQADRALDDQLPADLRRTAADRMPRLLADLPVPQRFSDVLTVVKGL
ncbi:MAG TPA: phosphotransferase [Mycobacteriales bacterium]|nr:phosphotransferase [Mycobacteriales bacterium]